MDRWNPAQYDKFQDERSRPFWDLAARVDFNGAKRLLDIGCGTGELTQALHTRHPDLETLGIDSSANMLQKAPRAPGLSFHQAAIEAFTPDSKFDVIFSNAALQWVGDHENIFRRIFGWLAPRGQLAVQMPCNFDHPSHRLSAEVAHDFGLAERQVPVLTPEAYALMMWNLGLREVDVSVQVYLHPMKQAREVVEWTKGTLLTYYQQRLDETRFAEFLREYERSLLGEIGTGAYVYPFKRLFIYGRLPA